MMNERPSQDSHEKGENTYSENPKQLSMAEHSVQGRSWESQVSTARNKDEMASQRPGTTVDLGLPFGFTISHLKASVELQSECKIVCTLK